MPSFLGNIVAGLAGGAGQGFVNEASVQEKLQAQLALDHQRSQDKLDQIALMSALKNGGGEGSGKGSKEYNLFERALATGDPVQQQRMIEMVRSFQGPEAADALASGMGQPRTASVQFPTNDDEGNPMPGPMTTTTRASYDARKGAVELKRLLATLADPAKLKDYAIGEGQLGVNDMVTGAVSAGSDKGLRAADAAAIALKGGDRFGVADGTSYDKTGLTGTEATAVGQAEIAQRRALAGKYGAEAGKANAEAGNAKLMNVPEGSIVIDRTGKTVASNPKPTDGKALTDAQAKALLFGSRAKDSNEILETIATSTGVDQPGVIKRAADALPLVGGVVGGVVNTLPGAMGGPSGTQQQVEQAQRDFINAVLRRESGAVISEPEFANARMQYFPQPGDVEKVREQKKRNREIAVRGILSEVPNSDALVQKVRGPAPAPAAAPKTPGGFSDKGFTARPVIPR